MKKLFLIICLGASLVGNANAQEPNASVKIRTVNFKRCAEQSKIGKQEQVSFEAIKKQMETVLLDKEKALNEMAAKFEDVDFMDGLSTEAEVELKKKFRTQSQEFAQLQQQYVQALQQTNFKIIQKLSTAVAKAANEAAQKSKLDMVVNDEVAFFASPSLDVTNEVVVIMDQQFEKEAQNPEHQNQPATNASTKKDGKYPEQQQNQPVIKK